MTLTVPLATVTGLADRPGEIPGIGPVDPWLARDLAAAAARNPKTTWCVTVTDGQGHAVGHGCARPETEAPPETSRTRRPGRARGFAFAATAEPGTWRLRVPGRRTGSAGQLRSRSIPGRVITGSRPRAMIRGSSCGTCPRSGTRPAPGRGAAGPPRSATSSTTPRTRRADGPACVTAGRSAGVITGSSRTRAGTSASSPTGRSGGPPRPDGPTPPNRRDIRSEST